MTQQTQPQTDQQQPQPQSEQETVEQTSPEEFERRYLEQQRRLACPGCGEEPFLG